MSNTTTENRIPTTAEFSKHLLLALSAIVTLLILGWVFWFSRYGIDFTDEGYYLVSISNPFEYKVSPTQFGYIYHPLYELLNGDIAALRQANILITFCLAWFLGNTFLKIVFGTERLDFKCRLINAAGLATTALFSLTSSSHWLPTPSYNSLAFQALLIAAVGLLLADKTTSRASIFGWVLIGIGGWLAFMAKPTTALVLALCSGCYLFAARKFVYRLVGFSLATAVILLVLSAFIIDGSIIAFVNRLISGMEWFRLIGGGGTHSLAGSIRIDKLILSQNAKIFVVLSTIAIFMAAYFSQKQNKVQENIAILISVACAIYSITIIFDFPFGKIQFGIFDGFLVWPISFAAILTGLALYRFKGLVEIQLSQWALAVCFLVFPYIYALGTNRNYWENGTNAAIFWVLSGLVFLQPTSSGKKFSALLFPLGFAAQLAAVLGLYAGFESPERQPQPLRENDYKLEVGKSGSELILSTGFGNYIAEAFTLAKQAGLRKGMPIIDLSGQSPGLLYALGATNIGIAWITGGYPGSNVVAVESFKKVPCEDLADAWLLVEPAGPRRISLDTLTSFGANVSADYAMVATWKTAEGAGGFKEARLQYLMKPVRPAAQAIQACHQTRM